MPYLRDEEVRAFALIAAELGSRISGDGDDIVDAITSVAPQLTDRQVVNLGDILRKYLPQGYYEAAPAR